MVGIILISHGQLAKSFLDVAKEILGDTDEIKTVCLPDPMDENLLIESVEKARKETDQGDGVLILTDMFGGTPCNVCFSLLEDVDVEVLTGMNLPMILKVLSSRKEAGLSELARIGMDCGRENIYLARKILEQRTRND